MGHSTSQLSGVVHEHTDALVYALAGRRSGIQYLLLGERQEPQWNGYWSGSPHVHLLEFSNQSASAAENERQHAEAFKWILARTPPRGSDTLRVELPRNTRAFNDYGVYINEATVLWVYAAHSNYEVSGTGTEDDPLSHPTHHHQVKGDLLEYAPILYRSLLHELE